MLSSMNIYDIKFEDSRTGRDINLSDYRGKVIMIVNTASFCGFTKQYSDLQAIWEKYRDQNFILIAVPTNDFGKQEPKGNDEIVEFCEVNFGINFPIAKKVTSKGDHKHEFFKLVKQDFSRLAGPKWNFYKYIYSSEGKAVNWFSSVTNPSSRSIKVAIEKNMLSHDTKK